MYDMHRIINQLCMAMSAAFMHGVSCRKLWMRVALGAIVAVGMGADAAAQVLWRVTAVDSVGGRHTSYVLGTMHTVEPEMLDTLAGMTEALERATVVYGEVDASDMALSSEALACAIAPSDSTLQCLLSPAALDSVCRYVSSFGVDGTETLKVLGRMKPAMLDAFLEVRRSGVSTDVSPDIALQYRARAMGREVRALETAEQQMYMLMSTPIAEQLESLMESVRAPEAAQAASDSLVAAYHRQDLAAIEGLLAREMGQAYAERMLYARNRAWAAMLAPEMRRYSVLVAVGAGHLVGPEGLLALLCKAGYYISPVGGSAPLPEQGK